MRAIWFGLALAAALTAAAASERVITADMRHVTGARDRAWQDSVGADHPGILLRPANLAHLKLVHDEIGFTYLRFHGIFHDDMGAYREVNGKPVHDFTRIIAVYDAILKTGMKPLVEIGFMPSDLASDSRTIFYWKANGSPPKDYRKWADFISDFTATLEAHFGAAEVRRWRFEIWNEPNLDGFWTGGNQAEYFRLYDASVRAIKSIDPVLKVGGPSTAGAAWVPAFLAHAKAAGVPVDFVTTHTYGVKGGFLDEKGEGDNKLDPDPNSIAADVWRVRREIEASAQPGLPLYFTEWSTSYNPRDPIHDAYLSAAFILEKLKQTEGAAQSMSYWTYTDLFEEAGPPPASFHGGFGLLNREDIRKPAYFAYKYLHALGDETIAGGDAHSLVSRTGADFAGLIWNYTTPAMAESDRPYFRKVHPATALDPVALAVHGLRPGTYKFTVHRTGYDANDAYTAYLRSGAPTDLSATDLAAMQAHTADKPEIEAKIRVGADGLFRRAIPIRSNDVVLVRLQHLSD